MKPILRFPLLVRAFSCWNWKCALMSAGVRSLVYLLAMLHGGRHSQVAVIAVEMGYVTLTAGLWAGLQQKALGLRSHGAGNLAIVVAVPGASQLFDYLAHCAAGATVPPHATMAVCFFTLLSALFHLYVMRRGAFLTGQGRSLADDFRSMPRLLAGFSLRPVAWVFAMAQKMLRGPAQEAAY